MKDIEKMQFKLFRLSDKYVLKHVVKFAYKDKTGARKGYHQVTIYPSNQYINDRVSDLKNINIYFKSYLVIECTDINIPWEKRQTIMITENTIHKFIKGLKKVKKWFKSKKYDDLFYIDSGVLKLNKEMATGMNRAVLFEYDKIIKMIPAVIYDNTKSYEGIMMFINDRSSSCELSINEVNTLRYILKKMDLYQAGLAHLNYLGRPKVFEETNISRVRTNDTYNVANTNYLRNGSDYTLNKELGDYFK